MYTNRANKKMVPVSIDLICLFDTIDFVYKPYCNVVDTSLIYKQHKQVDTFIFSAFSNVFWMKPNATSETRLDGTQVKYRNGGP